MACILRSGVRAWTNGQLPFTIRETGFTPSALLRITAAVKHWKTKTNWHIVPRTNETNYVEFRVGDECSSWVGRRGGKQMVTLSNNCTFGAAVHEIGHALGFDHEQCRRDRDNHVIVMTERVEPDMVHNFARVRASRYLDHGRYDYDSIMHYRKDSVLRRKRHNWTSGWSNVRFYSIGGETYLFLLKAGNGEVHVHRMDAALGVGREIQRFDWTSGWTSSEFYTVGGAVFLFLLKRSSGIVHIHRVNNDGTIGKRVQDEDWTSGWTSSEFYTVGGAVFLFLLKRSSGIVHIHRVNNDGTIGKRVQDEDWTSGWTSSEFYTVGNALFLLLLKRSSGVMHIQRMNNDGTIGKRVQDENWKSGWSNDRFYTIGGKTYLFLLKAGDGVMHIQRMNKDGTIGKRVQDEDWTSGWTSSEFYTVGGAVFLFLLKSSSGIVHIHAMRNNGKLGSELLLTPRINICAPRAIGQRSGLSPGDIAAANARI